MTDQPERAVIYRRVSTADQVEGTSLQTQLDVCLAEVEKRGLVLAEEWDFSDEGRSGKSLDRPAMSRLQTQARQAKFEAVIVAKADRLSRNHLDSMNLHHYLETLGIMVLTPEGDLIGRTPEQRLQRSILGSIAEFERDLILRRTTAGLRATAERGSWPGGQAPFGFKLIRAENRSGGTSVQVNEEEAAVLRKAAHLILDKGQTTGRVAAELNSLGMLPRRARGWNRVLLRKQLTTAPLSGKWIYRPTDADPIELEIPPLMSPERHVALLKALAATSKGRKADGRGKPYLLAGGRLVSPCGANYHGKAQKGRAAQYECSQIGRNSGAPCGCYRLPADEVEDHIWRTITDSLTSPENLMAVASRYLQARTTQMPLERDELAAVTARIATKERALSEQVAAYMEAQVSPSVVKAAVDVIEHEIQELRVTQRGLEASVAEHVNRSATMRALWDFAEQAQQTLPRMDAKQKRAVLDLLNIRVTVLGWETCGQCHGKSKVPGGHSGLRCPTCCGIRVVPTLIVDGKITNELLITSLPGADAGDPPVPTLAERCRTAPSSTSPRW